MPKQYIYTYLVTGMLFHTIATDYKSLLKHIRINMDMPTTKGQVKVIRRKDYTQRPVMPILKYTKGGA